MGDGMNLENSEMGFSEAESSEIGIFQINECIVLSPFLTYFSLFFIFEMNAFDAELI